MQIRITARHFDLTDELKAFTEQEISKLGRFFNHIIDSHMVLDVVKSRQTAELTLKVNGNVLVARSDGFDMRAVVEDATAKMEAQLKKHKEKLRNRKGAVKPGELLAEAEASEE